MNGSIAGTVTDSTGAVIAGAQLTITSLERKTVDTVAASENPPTSDETTWRVFSRCG